MIETAIVLGLGFAAAAWRLWVAIDGAEERHAARHYPQDATQGDRGDRDYYNNGEWANEEAAPIFTRLRTQEAENEARLAVLIQGDGAPNWDAWQRDPDPVAIPAHHQQRHPAPIQQAAPTQQAAPKGYKMPTHDAKAWGRDVEQRGKEAENRYCREHGRPEVWK